jgi:two-component system sensor histidine kinase DctS
MARPGAVEFSVSDNGPGVDPSVAPRLFRPFTTTKPHGMGVGLSLCKSIIESHGGDIGFRANAPRGAMFYFTLPTGRDQAVRPAVAAYGR